jgi:hypothetical protein
MDKYNENDGHAPTVTLEGAYSPSDYLEEAVTLNRPDCTATIQEGRIDVVFREPEPLPDADCQAAISREVHLVFQARLIMTGRPWRSTGLTLRRRYANGSSDIWLSATSMICAGSVGSPDIMMKDAEGNVVKDTKAERLTDERDFREQCLRHAEDLLFQELMASFSRAIDDPADLMTHLYEIRDALKRHFGPKDKAKKALGLTEAEWSDLGLIANVKPIQESRHRGDHPERRPATEEERIRVLEISRRMIRVYLLHLDRTP